MGGIRDPDWLDLPPIASLGIGVHSLANLPNNSTIKKKAAVIIMAVEVHAALPLTINCSFQIPKFVFFFAFNILISIAFFPPELTSLLILYIFCKCGHSGEPRDIFAVAVFLRSSQFVAFVLLKSAYYYFWSNSAMMSDGFAQTATQTNIVQIVWLMLLG